MTDTNLPASLTIRNACPKTWGELQGAQARRFCSACRLHVHDASALTRSEALALVRDSSESGERLCMRIVFDATGAPHFRDSTALAEGGARAPLGRLGRLARWSVAAGAGLLAACQPATAPRTGANGAGVAPGASDPQGAACTSELVGRIAAPGPPAELLGDVAVNVPRVEWLGEIAPPEDLSGDESPPGAGAVPRPEEPQAD